MLLLEDKKSGLMLELGGHLLLQDWVNARLVFDPASFCVSPILDGDVSLSSMTAEVSVSSMIVGQLSVSTMAGEVSVVPLMDGRLTVG